MRTVCVVVDASQPGSLMRLTYHLSLYSIWGAARRGVYYAAGVHRSARFHYIKPIVPDGCECGRAHLSALECTYSTCGMGAYDFSVYVGSDDISFRWMFITQSVRMHRKSSSASSRWRRRCAKRLGEFVSISIIK